MFPPGFTCPAVLWIRSARFRFRLRASHPLWRTFPRPSANFHSRTTVRTPKIRRPSVWPPPRSLATTCGISVDVFSCPYLDVSVQGVPRVQFRAFPAYDYFVHRTLTRYCRAGFPHSEISGSMRMCRSPELIAACRVLLRLLMPRHSPCALISLTISGSQL